MAGGELNRRTLLGGALSLSTNAIAPQAARAQGADYPSAVIKAISMFGPGSGADVKIRFYANRLAEKIGSAVVVENKAGAMGNIATEFVARAKPDGYTIYIAPTSSMLAAAPVLFKTLTFDPINDFDHITTLNFSAFVMCAPSAAPYKTIPELTAFLKQKGPKGSYGSIAPPSVVFGETYKSQFGLETLEVKYKDQGPMLVDLLNGSLDFACLDYISVVGMFKDGRLRPFCMSSAQRLKSIPDIAGAAEAGIPNLDVRNWWSVEAPAKTPKPILDKLEALFNAIAVEPETLQFLQNNGSDPLPGNSQYARDLLIQDTAKWRQYAKIAKIQPI